MTIFPFSQALLLAALGNPPPASTAETSADIVQIVSRRDEVAANQGAVAWIERHRADMPAMGKALVAAGFQRERADQPHPGCEAFTYAGTREMTKQDIIASFVICPSRVPAVLVLTSLAKTDFGKGPMPQIIGPLTTEKRP